LNDQILYKDDGILTLYFKSTNQIIDTFNLRKVISLWFSKRKKKLILFGLWGF